MKTDAEHSIFNKAKMNSRHCMSELFEIRRLMRDRLTRFTLLVLVIFGLVFTFEPTDRRHAEAPLANPDRIILGSGAGVSMLPSAPAPSEVVDPLRSNYNSAVGKVHAVFGEPNPVYERALELHRNHADIHGHPMFILRERILSGLWSKPAFILSVILRELEKPEESRLQWLL